MATICFLINSFSNKRLTVEMCQMLKILIELMTTLTSHRQIFRAETREKLKRIIFSLSRAREFFPLLSLLHSLIA